MHVRGSSAVKTNMKVVVTVVTMGLLSLRRHFASVYPRQMMRLITDRGAGGADTLVTSHATLPSYPTYPAESRVPMIFCGKQAIDGMRARAGPQIAEELRRGHVCL